MPSAAQGQLEAAVLAWFSADDLNANEDLGSKPQRLLVGAACQHQDTTLIESVGQSS